MPVDGKKLIFDKIQVAENCFGDLCSEISTFTKKKASLRDRYDEMSRILKIYGDAMRPNESLSTGLLEFSNTCTLLGDVQDLAVQRLQSKTIRDIAGYETICKNAREVLKQSLLHRGVSRRPNIDRSKSRAQSAFSQESDQITHENGLKNDFESKVFSFERQKIGDLREILLDFTLIQMQENVKALEILTEAHRHISDISVDDDLEDLDHNYSDKNANSLNGNSRSQSMSILDTVPNDSKLLSSSNLSNSAHSLHTLNKDAVQAHLRSHVDRNSSNKRVESNRSKSDDSDDDTEDETTESEAHHHSHDEEATETSRSDSVSSREKSANVTQTKRNSSIGGGGGGSADGIDSSKKLKSNAKQMSNKPVPQVRFSLTSRAK